ncbi:sulfotransferase domain-containing protein [Pyxidicoccus sp. MSG2]|uniref:sulfotransferase domain-containing protein n=1 Tax=Pyxidicoccus sp. MSG2 TaxID=2996790 RepID=UPI002271921A|nr:sulfotransferase domain-containing protein [Pyxidicoccus sp. MSG2]MCY1021306.1 sulfotransferase domain-containing protein [Pyxidicoccus sp. MSG2]
MTLLTPPVALAGLIYNLGQRYREMLRYRLEFRPQPADIFIATYPKSGTTWMQMLLVQLLSGGLAEFDHICQKSPYFEAVIRSGRFDFLEKLPSPRVFKTHMYYEMLRPSKESRIIFITRDAQDTFVSCYHHAELALKFRSPFDRFIDGMVRGRGVFGSWYGYMRSWMPHRNDANVLWVRYEDMKQDLEGQARRVAAFLGIPVPEERLADILEKCSFAYMRQHDPKFDFRLSMHEESPGHFIRQGGSGTRPQFREEHVAELERNLTKLRGDLSMSETERF